MTNPRNVGRLGRPEAARSSCVPGPKYQAARERSRHAGYFNFPWRLWE
jgi:hypothetical protein